jgi:hypothetical protein
VEWSSSPPLLPSHARDDLPVFSLPFLFRYPALDPPESSRPQRGVSTDKRIIRGHPFGVDYERRNFGCGCLEISRYKLDSQAGVE